MLHETLHVFTHADKSIFGFMGQVLVRPGQVVADYLAGRRKRYFSPFWFLRLSVGLATVLAKQLHYYDVVGEVVGAQLRAKHAPALLLALPTVLVRLGQQPGASTAALQGTRTVRHLLLIGRGGRGLGWAGAAWRALATGLLVAGINFGFSYAAFNWYVYGMR